MEIIKNYVQKNKERFINELVDLLKIASFSADSAYSQDVLNTDDKVKELLEEAGCDTVEMCETAGYPNVYGEKIVDENLTVVLVYGNFFFFKQKTAYEMRT